jgi:hypothetical protein
MDTDFLIYQKSQELWSLLLSDWKSNLFTVKYWGIIAFIIVAYMVWYKLTDKSRLVDLLLFGSFLAVMRFIIDLAGVTAGLWFYKEHTVPLSPSPFFHVLTITPLTYMLVQQYSANWRQFFIWNAVATGLIQGVVLPLFSLLGYMQLMHWNYLYGFIVMYVAATLSRAAFHLVIQVQHKAREGKPSPLESTILQAAFKPLLNQEDEDE